MITVIVILTVILIIVSYKYIELQSIFKKHMEVIKSQSNEINSIYASNERLEMKLSNFKKIVDESINEIQILKEKLGQARFEAEKWYTLYKTWYNTEFSKFKEQKNYDNS